MSLETSESLRQQFQLIQGQQQKKLLARKQRKTKTSEKPFQEDEGSTKENFWGHNGDSDNLDLKVFIFSLNFMWGLSYLTSSLGSTACLIENDVRRN